MENWNTAPHESIALFVKNIVMYDERELAGKTILPFFADGFPGIMFQETGQGMFVMPHQKQMPPFFLYGQTIQPIELMISGACHLIVFQLYPFVLNSFFDLKPKDLNDDCYDLTKVKHTRVDDIVRQLQSTSVSSERIEIITRFLQHTFALKKDLLDFKIRQAIQLIMDHSGQIGINSLCEELKINERTFERRFLAQVGVSAKQLSKIIQFDASLNQINEKDYHKLTDVVYANGFADQSHFIRVFKAFTGTTPKKFGNGQ